MLDPMVFSLVTGLPSTASATDVSNCFVQRLRGYYADVRLLASVHARITLWLPGPVRLAPDAGEVSRFSRVQFSDSQMAL